MSLGMLFGCRYDLKTSGAGIQRNIQLLLLTSIILIGAVPFAMVIANFLFQNDLIARLNDYTKQGLISFDYALFFHASSFYAITLLCSFLMGWLLIVLIEKGFVKIPVFHGPLYPLIVGSEKPVILCSVMTKLKHANAFIMYKGELAELSYASDNKINYIALRIVSRSMMIVDEKSGKVVEHKKPKERVSSNHQYVSYFGEPLAYAEEVFFIDGEDISNILLSRTDFSNIEVKIPPK